MLTGATAGVLRLLKYGSRAQLEALAKLCDKDEGFDVRALLLEVRKRMRKVLEEKGKWEEAKVFYLAALEGYRRVLGKGEMKTLGSLNNLGCLRQFMEDYEGALDYYQQALKGKEKILRKAHPGTLMTIINMAIAYEVGPKDLIMAEAMYRRRLDGHEKSLGKEHWESKLCVKNLAILLAGKLKDKVKTMAHVAEYTHLICASSSVARLLGWG